MAKRLTVMERMTLCRWTLNRKRRGIGVYCANCSVLGCIYLEDGLVWAKPIVTEIKNDDANAD